MARIGLYHSDVKKARDALLAQGRHPSVDAVRVELGNTGSKTTIHKYLKELGAEEGEGGGARKESITEALQDLVARLASQLHQDADGRIAAAEAQAAERERQQSAALEGLRQDAAALEEKMRRAESTLEREQAAHEQTRATLQAEQISRHTSEQQVLGLRERVVEHEAHRQSLEEKHQHAREALEHYRQSVKEQREQDQRRQEHQVQQLQAEIRELRQTVAVKQDDITRLNQEGARLVADLSHSQSALYDLQSQHRALQLEVVRESAQLAKERESQLAFHEAQAKALRGQVSELTAKDATASSRIRDLELNLATMQATYAAQEELIKAQRAHLAHSAGPVAEEGGAREVLPIAGDAEQGT